MCTSIRMKMFIYKVRYNAHTLPSLFPYCHTLSAQQSYFYFSQVYRVHLSSFRNRQSVVLYCRTPSILICHFCEVLFYTLKGRRRVDIVETVYIIHFQPHSHRHHEQIMQIFTLDIPSLCTYHLHDRSTQQKSCEVEIAIFPDIFMTQQTVAK